MDLGVLQILAHVDEEHLDLFTSPSQDIGEQTHAQPRQAVVQLSCVEEPDLFLQRQTSSDQQLLEGPVR